jgi:hypothetical protein
MATKKTMPKWLRKLSAVQRKHLAETCDDGVTLRAFWNNRQYQKDHYIVCRECEDIEHRLTAEKS